MPTYKNGNYRVLILQDGSKMRMMADTEESFRADFPESIDLKITDYCERGCPFCYENSSRNGKHGDILNLKFIDSLSPYTEIAIGGGNPISHPELVPFLRKLREKHIFANITVHQTDFMQNLMFLEELSLTGLVHGLGVSYALYDENFFRELSYFPNAVLHIINGIEIESFKKLYDKNLKVLLLGYKQLGRGKDFFSDTIAKNMVDMLIEIENAAPNFKVLSFDNLAIEQLNLRRFFTEEEWNKAYMGDDGDFTFFIDAVKQQFSKNSLSQYREPLKEDIRAMFQRVRLW